MRTKLETIIITALKENGIDENCCKKVVIDICKSHAGEDLIIPKKPLYDARNEMINRMGGTIEEIADSVGLSESQVRRIKQKE